MRMTGRALFASALMMAAGANAQAATQAECWKAIEQLKQHGVAVDQAIARQKANRTEASRCEMLAVTRKQVLQKIETSRVCGEFAPQNVAADIARAKAELDTLDSPDLKCNAAKPNLTAKQAEQKCSRDGDAMTAAGVELEAAVARMNADKTQTCGFVKAARQFISRSTAWAVSCRHHDEKMTAPIPGQMLEMRKNIEAKAATYHNGCR